MRGGADVCDVYVLPNSPYSTKVLAMLTYKRVPVRVREENLISRYTVLWARTRHTMVPAIVQGKLALSDSTRIARFLEEEHPQPPLHDPDPRRAALGRLLEQLADEWVVLALSVLRWRDRDASARNARIVARALAGGVPLLGEALAPLVPLSLRRRLGEIGAREENRAAVLGSLSALLEALEPVLARAPFLLGARPTLADFGLYGQLWQMRADEASRGLLPGPASAVLRWMAAMDAVAAGPAAAGDEVRLGGSDLAAHAPLLRLYAETWLRFACASAAALRTRAREAVAETPFGRFRARPRRYLEGCLKDDLAAVEGALTRAGDLLGGGEAEAPLWRELGALAAGPAREVLRPFPKLCERLW